jgi:hypothetical protein
MFSLMTALMTFEAAVIIGLGAVRDPAQYAVVMGCVIALLWAAAYGAKLYLARRHHFRPWGKHPDRCLDCGKRKLGHKS